MVNYAGFNNSFWTKLALDIFLLSFCCFSFVAEAETAFEKDSPTYINDIAAIEVSPPAYLSDQPPVALESWGIYGQFTGVYQSHPGFTSPYQGLNSLSPNNNKEETMDVTLYAGVRVLGGELWINPEFDQGFGLSNTIGMAGYPSGEAYKVGASDPYYRLPRAFYRHVINLGGEEQYIAPSANQLGRVQTSDNIIVTLGKFAVTDVFDGNAYAHDPRGDFFNWSIVESGAFDYAADAWGFTDGLSIEWTQSWWTFRAGYFALSTIPNTITVDTTFTQHEWVGEIEDRYQLSEHPGKIKLLGFTNQGYMGSYADAVQLGKNSNNIPDTALVRHFASRSGFAINIEQELPSDLGLFARLSKNDGSKEAFDFTEINQSAAVGLSLKGERWGRHQDTFGFAEVVNGLSADAISYFSAGGMGILIGDGNLNYGTEKITETYYSYAVPGIDQLMLTLNFQHVINPAYNQDRGPVNIFGFRVHKEF
jgi:high affinity Mn2+ porin